MLETGLLAHLFPAYEPLLRAENGGEIFERLRANLRGTDILKEKGEEFSDPMLLAAFVSPFTYHEQIRERMPDGRGRSGFLHHEDPRGH
ncbi:MAG: hypothetical protein M5R36_22300 [Deltaproteobacteria bacterium]|nr:hypothetical protein [Deltaproteobacteria bacterium]